jgi:hypothetical protein
MGVIVDQPRDLATWTRMGCFSAVLEAAVRCKIKLIVARPARQRPCITLLTTLSPRSSGPSACLCTAAWFLWWICLALKFQVVRKVTSPSIPVSLYCWTNSLIKSSTYIRQLLPSPIIVIQLAHRYRQWNRKSELHYNTNLQLDLILNLCYPLDIFTACLPTINVNIVLMSTCMFLKWSPRLRI